MVEFSTTGWIVLGVTAGLGLLAMLNAAASVVRNQTYVHDTRVRVNTLRKDYFDRAPEPEEGEIEAIPVDEPAPGRKAA